MTAASNHAQNYTQRILWQECPGFQLLSLSNLSAAHKEKGWCNFKEFLHSYGLDVPCCQYISRGSKRQTWFWRYSSEPGLMTKRALKEKLLHGQHNLRTNEESLQQNETKQFASTCLVTLPLTTRTQLRKRDAEL